MGEEQIEQRTYSVDNIPEGKYSKPFRDKAQVINFEQLEKLLQQNVLKNPTRTFNKFTKDLIQQYMQNPLSNMDNLRSASQFLWRVSSSYRKIIEYTALMPLFSYNITYVSEWHKKIDKTRFLKTYQKLARNLQRWNFKEIGSTMIATALRDGMCVGLVYDSENKGVFMQYLDPKYCKVSGVSEEGNYVCAFDASFFDVGSNKEFLYGINGNMEGIWDKVFIDGYQLYQQDKRNGRWFQLPIDRTCCILADDDAVMPLPYYVTIFTDLMDIIDYQSIVRSKTELQNFVLLYQKIPLMKDTKDVDDFALDIDTVQHFNSLLDNVVPDLVGLSYGAAELDTITFKDLNNTDDTDIVSDSIHNLLSKVGVSELLFNSNKTGSIGLDASIKIDEAFAMRFVSRFEQWMASYVRNVMDKNYIFQIHKISNMSQKTYLDTIEKQVTLGVPRHLDWATASGNTPFEIMNKTMMIQALDLNSLWVAPKSSWTSSDKGKSGGQEKDTGDLSPEGEATRDGNKNQTTIDG